MNWFILQNFSLKTFRKKKSFIAISTVLEMCLVRSLAGIELAGKKWQKKLCDMSCFITTVFLSPQFLAESLMVNIHQMTWGSSHCMWQPRSGAVRKQKGSLKKANVLQAMAENYRLEENVLLLTFLPLECVWTSSYAVNSIVWTAEKLHSSVGLHLASSRLDKHRHLPSFRECSWHGWSQPHAESCCKQRANCLLCSFAWPILRMIFYFIYFVAAFAVSELGQSTQHCFRHAWISAERLSAFNPECWFKLYVWNALEGTGFHLVSHPNHKD